MAISKKALITLALIGLFVGAVAGAAITQYFYQKIDYEFEGIAVAYPEETPFEFAPLKLNMPYEYDDTTTEAIKVFVDGNIQIKIITINSAHFSAFAVEVWKLPKTAGAPIRIVNMGGEPQSFPVLQGEKYGYVFKFTTTGTAGASGTVKLEVFFESS